MFSKSRVNSSGRSMTAVIQSSIEYFNICGVCGAVLSHRYQLPYYASRRGMLSVARILGVLWLSTYSVRGTTFRWGILIRGGALNASDAWNAGHSMNGQRL